MTTTRFPLATLLCFTIAWSLLLPSTSFALDCLSAPVLTCGQTVHGDITGRPNTTSNYGCGGNWPRGELVYKFVATSVQDLSVRLTADNFLGVFILNGCDPNQCLGSAIASSIQPGSVALSALQPGTYVIVVDGGLGEGPFDLEVICGGTLDCSSALPISCGQTLQGTTIGGTDHAAIYPCSPLALDGPDAMYELTIAQQIDVVLTVTGFTPSNPFEQMHMMFLTGCSTGACISHATILATGGSLSIPAVQPGTYYIIIDAPPGIESNFYLKVQCVQMDCSAAIPITCGGIVNGDTQRRANRTERYNCFNFTAYTGGEQLYQLDLAQDDDIFIGISNVQTGGITSQMGFFLLDDCSINSCLQYASAANGTSTHLAQSALPAGTYYIVADSTHAAGGTYTLELFCGSITDPQSVDILTVSERNFPEIEVTFKPKDRMGNFVTGLTAADFNLTEDLALQTINRFEEYECGTAIQVSIALVLDRSGSMETTPPPSNMDLAKQSAISLINALSPGDRASITAFDETVMTYQTMTNNHQDLINAINAITAGGLTAVYDGAYEGVRQCVGEPGTKAVFLFSDGGDNSSTVSYYDVINYAVQNNVKIYTIQIGQGNDAVMQNIAYATGGTFAWAPTAADLARIYDALYRNLKSTYFLTYTTTNATPDLTARNVELCYEPGHFCDMEPYIAKPNCQWFANETNAAGDFSLDSGSYIAQQLVNTYFQGPVSDLGVEIFFNNDVASEVSVSWWSDMNNSPGTRTVDAEPSVASIECPGWYEFSFSNTLFLIQPDISYWIVVQHRNLGESKLTFNTTGPAGGVSAAVAGPNPNWTLMDPNQDIFLRVYGCGIKPSPTPTPTGATPYPTATPTPTPPVPLPLVYAGGYMNTRLNTPQGGAFTFLGMANGNGNTVTGGEFYFSGSPTGITVGVVDVHPPLAILQTTVPLGPLSVGGRFPLEFRALASGLASTSWPYLTVQ